jgi:hypothetical protein
VPSERAFSIQNLLLNKLRNRLSTERVDKLQYIYINQRVLNNVKWPLQQQEETQGEIQEETEDRTQWDEELIELEDELIGNIEGSSRGLDIM